MHFVKKLVMMKNIFYFLLFFPSLVFAQQPSTLDSVAMEMKDLFNNENFDQVYNNGSVDFQASVSKAEFLSFCVGLKFAHGKMRKFINLKTELLTGDYEVVFEKDTLIMKLGITKSRKISILVFRPIEIKAEDKTAFLTDENLFKKPLDLKIDSIMKPYILRGSSVGAIVGVITKGRNYIYSYGETKLGNKTLPDTNTIFEIASVTKTFTALLVALEAVRGIINLDAPINKYLPSNIPFQGYNGKPVLIKHLASHTSSLPLLPTNINQQIPIFDPHNPFKNYRRENLYSFLKSYKYIFPPGKKFLYSNLGAGLLGNILENVSKISYEALLQKEICKPLNLKNTMALMPVEKIKQMAQGYNQQKQAVPAWDFKVLAGAGAIRSCIGDILKYASIFLAPPNEDFKNAITLCEKIVFNADGHTIGLGWQLLNIGKRNIYFHNGQTEGFTSFISYDKEKQSAVILLTNTSYMVDKEGAEIMKYLAR